MEEITVDGLKKVVEANKAYRLQQRACYYGDDIEGCDIRVNEYCDMDRLEAISKCVGIPMRVSLRDKNANPEALIVDFDGCRFWTTIVKAFGGRDE